MAADSVKRFIIKFILVEIYVQWYKIAMSIGFYIVSIVFICVSL